MLQYALIKRDTFYQAAYTGCPAHRCRVSIADVKTLFLTPCLPRRFDRCWNSSINVHHHWGYSSSSRPRLTRQNNAQHVLRPFSLPSPAVMPHPLTSAKCLNETPNVTQKNSCRRCSTTSSWGGVMRFIGSWLGGEVEIGEDKKKKLPMDQVTLRHTG